MLLCHELRGGSRGAVAFESIWADTPHDLKDAGDYHEMWGRSLCLEDSSVFLDADSSPLRSSQMLVDAALERSAEDLSNAVSQRCLEVTQRQVVGKSELGSARLMLRPPRLMLRPPKLMLRPPTSLTK